jgi:hypothetical protein
MSGLNCRGLQDNCGTTPTFFLLQIMGRVALHTVRYRDLHYYRVGV